MRYVAARIGEQQAREALRPRRPWRLRLGRSGQGGIAGKRLPHLELVWLPFLHAAAGARSCVVCASTGLAARLALDGLSFTAAAGVVPAAIGRERLIDLARSHFALLDAWAGGASSGRAGRPPALEDWVLEDWALPFWVLHFERRPGRLDFSAIDALSGARVGGAVRQALLRAMLVPS